MSQSWNERSLPMGHYCGVIKYPMWIGFLESCVSISRINLTDCGETNLEQGAGCPQFVGFGSTEIQGREFLNEGRKA